MSSTYFIVDNETPMYEGGLIELLFGRGLGNMWFRDKKGYAAFMMQQAKPKKSRTSQLCNYQSKNTFKAFIWDSICVLFISDPWLFLWFLIQKLIGLPYVWTLTTDTNSLHLMTGYMMTIKSYDGLKKLLTTHPQGCDCHTNTNTHPVIM